MTRYRNKGGALSTRPTSHDLDDSEPPNVSYIDDRVTTSCHDDLDDDMESIDEEDSDNEWGDPSNFAAAKEGDDSEMDSLVTIEKFETEWEHLEPSEQETRLFEEEQMRRQLRYGSTHDHAHQPPSASSHHQAMLEREIHRDRRRRLDYDSTYMDFAASVASSGDSGSIHLTTTDTVKLFSSINKSDRGGNEGASPPGCRDEIDGVGTGDGERSTSEQSRGIFGTLSSLWTSTFGGR